MSYLIFHIVFLLVLGSFPQRQLITENHQVSISIIVHESIDTSSIDKDELLDIYTLSKQRWEDNSRIQVADYKGSPAIRALFYDELNTSSNNIKRIWLRAQFTGRSTPPKVVNSVDEMIEIIIDFPGTIGYVPSTSVPANVKVLIEIDG